VNQSCSKVSCKGSSIQLIARVGGLTPDWVGRPKKGKKIVWTLGPKPRPCDLGLDGCRVADKKNHTGRGVWLTHGSFQLLGSKLTNVLVPMYRILRTLGHPCKYQRQGDIARARAWTPYYEPKDSWLRAHGRWWHHELRAYIPYPCEHKLRKGIRDTVWTIRGITATLPLAPWGTTTWLWCTGTERTPLPWHTMARLPGRCRGDSSSLKAGHGEADAGDSSSLNDWIYSVTFVTSVQFCGTSTIWRPF
jgi:hypothetical protein